MESTLDDKTKEIVELTTELNNNAEKLLDEVTQLNEMVKKLNEKYDKCNHVWFISGYGHDEEDNNFSYNYTCVKCHRNSKVTQKSTKFCDDNGVTQYFLNVEQDPEYMFALYREISRYNPGMSDLQIAGLIQSFVEHNQEIDETKKCGIARELKISPRKINKNVSFGE